MSALGLGLYLTAGLVFNNIQIFFPIYLEERTSIWKWEGFYGLFKEKSRARSI